jgi:hypothetical protein
MSDEQRIREINARFLEDGYELVVHPVEHGGYFAPYMRIQQTSGNARFTWGKTALDAAEAALAEFEASKNNAAAAEAIRRGIAEDGGLFGQNEPEQPRRDLGLERDISRRDEPS